MMFSDNTIRLQAYPMEQILSDKLSSIIAYGKDTTRMRDFYDVYNISKLENYNINRLSNSFTETMKQRNINQDIIETQLKNIKDPSSLKNFDNLWFDFQRKNSYAKDISFKETVYSTENMISDIKNSRNDNFKKIYYIAKKV